MQQTPPKPPQKNSNNTEADKGITYLCYLGILVVIPLLVKQDSEFVKFHSKQGLVLLVGWFIGGFLYPFLGLGLLVHLAIIILSIMGLMNVSKGEKKDLPVIGGIAEKFNF